MAGPIPPLFTGSSSSLSSSGGLSGASASSTGDPKAFALMVDEILNQGLNTLFSGDSGSSDGSSLGGGTSTNPLSLLNGLLTNSSNSTAATLASLSPLIGRTVTGQSSTGQAVKGSVQSIALSGSQAILNLVGGLQALPNSLSLVE